MAFVNPLGLFLRGDYMVIKRDYYLKKMIDKRLTIKRQG